MYLVNVAIADTFILRDNSNVAITGKVGADFATIEAYEVTTPATTATVTLTEIGNGEYRISFTPTTPTSGTDLAWTSHVVYNSGGVFREFSPDPAYLVSSDDTGDVVVVPTAASSGTARYLLRRTISRKLGNYVPVVATANSGNATTIVDNVHLRNPDNAYAGRQVYFYSGTVNNIGLSRFITSSTQSTTLVTFPTVTSNVVVGDVAEIHNVRGSGWLVEEIHDEIDTVLRWASTSIPNYDREDIVTAFDMDAPTVTIPSSFTAIYRIDWLDSDGFYHEIDAASEPRESGWWLNRGEREVIINGDARSWADDLTIRMYGVKQYAALSTDASVTPCNEEWLVLQVCANLLQAGSERVSDGTRAQWSLQMQKAADQRRDLLVGPPPPNLVVV